jgi:hypothetical protein
LADKFGKKSVQGAEKLTNQILSLGTDIALVTNFFAGTGLENYEFGPNEESTISLKNSFLTTTALKKFMAEYKNNPSQKSYNIGNVNFNPFAIFSNDEAGPVNSLWNDKGYSTAQFTGSCHYSFEVVGDHVNITVSNRTSLWSALYHLPLVGAPSRGETPLGMAGNIYQTYTFTISLDEARKRGN